MTDDQSQNVPELGRGAAWELARHIQSQIQAGIYQPGSRLPTHRELMSEHELTQGTVSYAMSILAVQGYVERRHGSGVFVRSAEFRTAAVQQPTGLIALIIPDFESGEYASLLAGLEQSVRKFREHLITVSTGGGGNKQADVLMQLIDREVAGVALVPSEPATCGYQLRHLQKVNVPLVLLQTKVADVSVPLIEFPATEIGQVAGEELCKHGHRRIGAVLEDGVKVATQYLSGLREAASARECEISDESIAWCDRAPGQMPRGWFVETIKKLLAQPDRPTALFAGSCELGVRTFDAVLRAGLRVPNDISILWGGHQQRSPLEIGSVAADGFQVGKKAHELLTAMRRGERLADQQENIPMPITVNLSDTCGAAPK